jgi:outer membrane protein OmpU
MARPGDNTVTQERIMKKVLLTTTALVMTAGVAAAEVSFSGTAGIALVDDNGKSLSSRTGMFVESYYDLDVAVSAAADNGMTFALGFDMGSGNKIDYNDDDVLEAQGEAIGNADVSMTYQGWTIKVDQAGIDNLFDDTDGAQDLSVSGSIADFAVAFTSDLEADTSSYSLGTTVAGIALTFTGTDNDDAGGSAAGVSASYTVSDTLSLKGSMSNESNDAEDDASIGLTYKMDALTLGYTSIKPGTNGDLGDEWDLSIAYSAGAMSASFAVDEADATTMIAEWDLGGATAFAAMHDKAGTANDLTTMGINFSF